MVTNLTFSVCRKEEKIYLYRFDIETASFALLGIFANYIGREETAVFYSSSAFNQVGKIRRVAIFSQTGVYFEIPLKAVIMKMDDDCILYEEGTTLYQASKNGTIVAVAESASDVFRVWKNDKEVFFDSVEFEKFSLADFSIDDKGFVTVKGIPWYDGHSRYVLKRTPHDLHSYIVL